MPEKKPTVAIILPAYNEEKVIGKVLDEIPRKIVVKKVTYPISIVVINDSSTDKTAEVVKTRKDVVLINHLLNSGAGAATRTGLTYARDKQFSYVATMDADGQHKVKDVLSVLEVVILNKADFVIGSRLINSQGMPMHRVFGNKALSLITFLLFGVFVTDSQSGLKSLNRNALQKIKFYSNNFAFCSEMLWKAKQQHLRIKEIPIRPVYTSYSLSKGQSNWGAVHIVEQLLIRRLLDLING